MKQFWIGLGLLGLILVSGLFLGNRMEQTHHPQAKDLDKAAAAAAEGDWEYAAALLTRAKKNWDESRDLAAALVHHEPLNDIDTRFAELGVYAKSRSNPDFSAGCAALAEVLRALPKSHKLSWWNLL